MEVYGGAAAPAIDGLQVDGSIHAQEPDNQLVTCAVSGSDDGKTWQPLGHAARVVPPPGELPDGDRVAHALVQPRLPQARLR